MIQANNPLRRIRYRICGLVVTFGLLVSPHLQGELIERTLEEALAEAQSESKLLYVAFLGEDWSLSSKRFMDNILSSPEFQAFAKEEIVYFPVMARRKPPLTKEETAQLQALVIHFDIKAYPTVIILAPDGQEMLRHPYKEISVTDYIDLLKAILP